MWWCYFLPQQRVSLLNSSVLQAAALGAAGTHPHVLQEGPRGPVRRGPEGALAGESQVGLEGTRVLGWSRRGRDFVRPGNPRKSLHDLPNK